MKKFLKGILRDKNREYSMRELVVAIFVAATLTAWACQQLLSLHCPEFMFYSFVSLIAAGCFGYSIERKTFINHAKDETEDRQTE